MRRREAVGEPTRVLVLSSTFPQFDADPRGAFIRRHWEHHALGGQRVRMLVPRTAWTRSDLDTPLEVVPIAYAPRFGSTLTGRYGILENIRERPWRAALYPMLWWRSRRALAREIRSFRPHRVVAHMFLPYGLMVARACRRTGIPYELYGHGTDVDLVLRLPKARRARIAAALRGASRIWLPSKDKLARVVDELFPRGPMPAMAVETMVRSVPATRSDITRPVGEHPEPSSSSRPPIVYVGRLIRQKGLDVLLDAVARLPERVPVEIAGDGPLRRRLERRARQLGLECRFLGFVDERTRDRLYARAGVVCVPSIEWKGLSEGAPLVVVEARRFGVPVVASAVGGIPELCDGDPGATLVPPGDPERLAQELHRALVDGDTLGSSCRRVRSSA